MLRELQINNLALVERLHVTFSDGLQVVTGETGAGKSIILQALFLLTGGRASAAMVRRGAESALIEASFEVQGDNPVVPLLADKGFLEEDQLILKRIIAARGKSRFYINGQMATAKTVSEVSENLISIASQHEHQLLLRPAAHLDLLDAMGGITLEADKFSVLFGRWQDLRRKYNALQVKERDREQRRDFLKYQVKEIGEAAIKINEDEELRVEKERLRASDQLRRISGNVIGLLEKGLTEYLQLARKELEKMADLDSGVASLAEGVADNTYQLEDRVVAMREYLSLLPTDSYRLDDVVSRLDLLQQMKRKYGNTLGDVLDYADKAAQELVGLDKLDDSLKEIAGDLRVIEKQVLEAAKALTEKRRHAADELASRVGSELQSLAMKHAVFVARFADCQENSLDEIHRLGHDRVEFLFSANPGEPVKPVGSIASGGELSRLLLALKCLLARRDQVETVLFDEVDAGISGKAAESVGEKIRELANHHQVLCITHLPQIAALAHCHFLVEKRVVDDRTRTQIASLDQESRKLQLASMLDGENVSGKTLAYAEELLARKQ